MSRKKKQELNKKAPIMKFVIPQLPKKASGIRKTDGAFKITPALSSMWGRANIDVSVVPPTENLPYTDRSLDYLRKPEDKKCPQDNSDFSSVIFTNADRQKFFPNSKPITDLEKKEEPKPVPHNEHSVSENVTVKPVEKTIEKKKKKEKPLPIIKPVPEETDEFVLDLDNELLFGDPVYINFDMDEKEQEVVEQEEIEEFKPVVFDEEYVEPVEEVKPVVKPKPVVVEQPKKVEKVELPKKTNYTKYKLPPLSIFKRIEVESDMAPEWIEDQILIINNTLAEFGVDGSVVNYTKGPAVTRYEISLKPGVVTRKVTSIENEIAMNLSAKKIHIEAPIPGKPYVGIEVPNKVVDMVNFGNICYSDEFQNASKLSFGLGINLNGEIVTTKINKMPHGLIAGKTGSGKSVCINTLIISLLMKNKPDELKMMLIDPKFVEMCAYEGIPHLVTPVISDPKLAAQGLKWACDEMDNRYMKFVELGARNIEGYNEKIEKDYPEEEKMPYIVIIIDELADLMQTASADVEQSIQRITQKARAAGIHLIVATQRPTTDVVKGTIKANIPTRIAFSVSSYTDSMTILDYGGAESLLGRGDMFLKTDEATTRIQGAYISDEEIDAVCNFIRNESAPDYIFTHESLGESATQMMMRDQTDEMFEEAARYVVEMQSASINNLQKAKAIGFNRAQKLIDMMEEAGIVSESSKGKAREVLVQTVEELDAILNGK